MSPGVRKPTMWILNRSDTNQAVQLLEMARGLTFCFYEVEVLFFPSSENKGADQLRGHREGGWSASLFSHMHNVGFLTPGLIYMYYLIHPSSSIQQLAIWQPLFCVSKNTNKTIITTVKVCLVIKLVKYYSFFLCNQWKLIFIIKTVSCIYVLILDDLWKLMYNSLLRMMTFFVA